MPNANVQIKETGDIERLLRQLPGMVRRDALKKALRAGANVVKKRAKQLCPKPGYSGDKPGLKPLRDTIGVVVRDYEHTVVAVVGPQYPAGAHGHLVEHGHAEVLWGKPTGRRVPPRPFMRPAADETQSEQQKAIVRTLEKEIDKIARQTLGG